MCSRTVRLECEMRTHELQKTTSLWLTLPLQSAVTRFKEKLACSKGMADKPMMSEVPSTSALAPSQRSLELAESVQGCQHQEQSDYA